MNHQVKTILIVDDIQENLQVLGNILQQNAYGIRFARNGEQALKSISKKMPDLILLDISMPGMNGYEVCQQLKSQDETEHIPVIFLTARTEKDDIVNGFKAGGVDYITKPFYAEELISRVKTHIELNDAREELVQLNATKDKFFSIIGHDLKGPIGQIIQLSEFMEGDLLNMEKERIMVFLSHMKETSKRSLKLLENLLEWSCSQTGNILFKPESFLFSELVKENIALLKRQAEEKSIELRIADQYTGEIVADRNMISTVIRNLVSNAIKFTRTGGLIEISSLISNDDIIVSIKDNGIGMSCVNCNEIFRIDSIHATPGTNNEKGTGIGLILCKEFVERHNGKIWIDSELDVGSTFSFSIPMK